MVPGALLSETSEQYTYRAEFFFGDLNEGRDYEDVKAQNMEYLGFLQENDLKYGRALFILFGRVKESTTLSNMVIGLVARNNIVNGVHT